ncbi:MAG TPA: CDP-diacylglycerol--glycerol-3-phosphate 3-phosphatidyltransferase [Firmicutes bacterium]|jgi:CDP-diacylglycerol--glycerol-3-phosphate 3-phosphatidyltransferase|nr:CDP-diacylglycerol--glycerol-3-phosphate 3-phosphatidyltransferase [Bacillota bacterium]HBK68837.1 CDP-diacylglycerol--glycerol-3-phosphate 3-phosphatidyltransferase [Bacillota bacterium]HBT16679.1 CDP-diacylglycerol--glycerol-3-phosphate 3-phosphatidyltransferase [Bacillota bacterium]
MKFKLADYLTLLRIVLTPICLLFLFLPVAHKELFAAGIFIVAALTDGLDGYVARVRKETTSFGKSFDPLADKILIGSALYSLFMLGKVSGWVLTIILGREILITILRALAKRKGFSVGAGVWGKIKTFTQIIAIIMIILSLPGADILLYVALFFTVFSGVDYLIKWRGIVFSK